MAIVLLDLMIALAVLCSVVLQVISFGNSGPDGKIPLSLMIIPPVVLVGIVAGACMLRGVFPIPLPLWAGASAWCGIIPAVWILLTLSIDPQTGAWRFVAGLATYVLFAACVVGIHGAGGSMSPAVRIIASAVLGLFAASGFVVGSYGVWGILVKGPEEDRLAAEQIKLGEARWEFEHIETGAPMWRFLTFIDSDEPAVRQKARQRIAAWPDRDDALIAEMPSWFREVASYIANSDPHPAAKLGPAFGRELVRSLEFWEHAFPGPLRPEWKKNFEDFVQAADRLQKAGTELREPLEALHLFMQRDPQLKAYADRVSSMLHATASR